MRIFLTILLTLALTGCGFTPFLYKADVVQGNIFTDAELSRITLGMTQQEVENILGSPQLNDPFHHRSNYVYEYFSGENRHSYQRSTTIYYNQAGFVERIETQDLKLKP